MNRVLRESPYVVFLGFRVTYGDPSLAAQTGFYLIMTTALLLRLGFVRRVLPRWPDYVGTAHMPLVSN